MKFTRSILVISLLWCSLYANPFFYTTIDYEMKRFDRYFDSMFQPYNKFGMHSSFKIDMYENNSSYIVEFEVQGIEKKDLNLSVEEGNVLKLEVSKKDTKDSKDKKYIKEERYLSNSTRMVKIPQNGDIGGLSAEHKNGILIVNVPKKEVKKEQSKVIKIK